MCWLLSINESLTSSVRLSIVESIPENLTFSYGAPMQYSTYQSWMDLLSAAKKSVDIASFYWTLQSFNDTSDVTDKQVKMYKLYIINSALQSALPLDLCVI